MRFSLNQKKNLPHQALNPEPAAYNFSALTATLQMANAKLQESVILMQRAWQNHDITMVKYALWFLNIFFLKDRIQLSSHYLIDFLTSRFTVCF